MTVRKKGLVITDIQVDEFHAFWRLFGCTTHAINKARERELRKFGISGEIAALLATIAVLGKDSTPTAIAKILFLEPHSVSQNLTTMQRKGLIRKVKDLERRNLIRAELTAAGREAFIKSSHLVSTRKILMVLTEAERREMWSYFIKLRDRAIKELHIKNPILYPPSHPAELFPESATDK